MVLTSGDGQVDFEEFMTILGPKLLSSETREGFLGSTIDTIFWQVEGSLTLVHVATTTSLKQGFYHFRQHHHCVLTLSHLCKWFFI